SGPAKIWFPCERTSRPGRVRPLIKYTLPPTGSLLHAVTSMIGLAPRRVTMNFQCGFQSLDCPERDVAFTRQ
ncbi:hypothetical protein OFM21_32285, partial [Escherichia coli]|nr:hypothetical protein [Escherichia coli]